MDADPGDCADSTTQGIPTTTEVMHPCKTMTRLWRRPRRSPALTIAQGKRVSTTTSHSQPVLTAVLLIARFVAALFLAAVLHHVPAAETIGTFGGHALVAALLCCIPAAGLLVAALRLVHARPPRRQCSASLRRCRIARRRSSNCVHCGCAFLPPFAQKTPSKSKGGAFCGLLSPDARPHSTPTTTPAHDL